jgi:hypothetical protein
MRASPRFIIAIGFAGSLVALSAPASAQTFFNESQIQQDCHRKEQH